MFPLDLNALARRIRDRMESAGVIWKGYHAFRRGLASNLFERGVPDIVVQRVLRHSKLQVTREKYIKLFDPRRGGRVAEGGGLLNRYTVKSCIGGSNPPLSAS